MASVFRGEQDAEPRDVAVKIMHAALLRDATFAKRFAREAKAAARIVHPNSVRILEHGADGDILYLAMELLAGQDLFDVLARERRLPEARAVRILLQVCGALGAAHAHGIVHRDLKPENVMILPAPGEPSADLVKVLDFGIAKILDRASPRGRASPQRARRRPHEQRRRARCSPWWAASWARPSTCRPSSPGASPSTRAATSTRAAPSSIRWSPAGRRSGATTSSTCSCPTPTSRRRRRARSGPTSTPGWSGSSSRPSRRAPTTASRPLPSSSPSSAPSSPSCPPACARQAPGRAPARPPSPATPAPGRPDRGGDQGAGPHVRASPPPDTLRSPASNGRGRGRRARASPRRRRGPGQVAPLRAKPASPVVFEKTLSFGPHASAPGSRGRRRRSPACRRVREKTLSFESRAPRRACRGRPPRSRSPPPGSRRRRSSPACEKKAPPAAGGRKDAAVRRACVEAARSACRRVGESRHGPEAVPREAEQASARSADGEEASA